MAASDITCSDLTAIDDVAGIKLEWEYNDPRDGALPNISLAAGEVWAATVNDRADGSFSNVGEGITDYLHAGLGRGASRFYWVRARDKLGGYGPWYPLSATAGVQGTELSGDILIATNGYWRNPNGLLFQWGRATADGSGNITITFATDWLNNTPSSVFSWVGMASASGLDDVYSINYHGINIIAGPAITLSVKCKKVVTSGGVTVIQDAAGLFVEWIAVGI